MANPDANEKAKLAAWMQDSALDPVDVDGLKYEVIGGRVVNVTDAKGQKPVRGKSKAEPVESLEMRVAVAKIDGTWALVR